LELIFYHLSQVVATVFQFSEIWFHSVSKMYAKTRPKFGAKLVIFMHFLPE
jgi:hypothetical protein